jgi:hypothetical protein
MYMREVDRVGLSVQGEVFVEVQPHLFDAEVDVTYRARLRNKEREP